MLTPPTNRKNYLAVILSLIKFKVPLHSYGFYLLRHGFYLSCDRAHTCQAETIPITWGALVLTEGLKSRCGVALWLRLYIARGFLSCQAIS